MNSSINAAKAKPATSPIASRYTSSPLRNRLRVELDAAVSQVWALVSDLSRFPEYSSGLARVEVRRGPDGALAGYTCIFKPFREGEEGLSHREVVRWFETEKGFASSAEGPNFFGLRKDLNLLTLSPSDGKTVLTWDEYYEAEDLAMNKSAYDQALADIGENLVRRFGGRIVERYVEE